MLLEDDQGEFIVDRQKLSEARVSSGQDGVSLVDIPGRFSVCDTINGNNRRYSRRVWEQQLKEDSALMQLIGSNSCFGLLEHPKDGVIDLLSPISHVVTGVTLSENGDVSGTIRVLNTNEGRKLAAMIEAGYNPRVSSRGFGSVERAPDGVDNVMEDYVCEGWDVVFKPSFSNAILTPRRSSSESVSLRNRFESLSNFRELDTLLGIASKLGYKTVDEAWEANPTLQPGTPLRESKQDQAVVSQLDETKNPQSSTMSLEQIKERLRVLTSDPTKMSTAAISESLRVMDSLHQEVAKQVAADPASSWEGQKIHESISTVEKTFHEAIEAPKHTASKIAEQNGKLAQVVRTVAETASSYKKKLAESYKREQRLKDLVEELTKRGRGWKSRAETRSESLASTNKKYTIATDALDIMAERYKTDVTALGKRVIELEFGDAAKNESIAKALSEAKIPRDLLKIRESLERSKKPGKPAVSESKKTPAPAKTPEQFQESKGAGEKPAYTPVNLVNRDPMDVNESVAIAMRLAGRKA